MSESNVKSKEAWYDECVALQQDGELALAVSELRKLLAVYSDYALARLALAVFLQEKGDEDGALDEMQRACELAEDDPFYFSAFSALAHKCGDREKAEEALEKAMEIRLQAQLQKMNELRNQELAARAERDRASTVETDDASDSKSN